MTIENTTAKDEALIQRSKNGREFLQKTGLQLLNNISNGFEVPTTGSAGIIHFRQSAVTDPLAHSDQDNTVGLTIQIDPESSTDDEVAYNAQFVNIAKWREARSNGVAFGEEVDARIGIPFESQDARDFMPWDSELLIGLIKSNLKDLQRTDITPTESES